MSHDLQVMHACMLAFMHACMLSLMERRSLHQFMSFCLSLSFDTDRVTVTESETELGE